MRLGKFYVGIDAEERRSIASRRVIPMTVVVGAVVALILAALGLLAFQAPPRKFRIVWQNKTGADLNNVTAEWASDQAGCGVLVTGGSAGYGTFRSRLPEEVIVGWTDGSGQHHWETIKVAQLAPSDLEVHIVLNINADQTVQVTFFLGPDLSEYVPNETPAEAARRAAQHAFFEAARRGDIKELQEHLDAGVDINRLYRDLRGSAIGSAVQANQHEAVAFLLDSGAEIRDSIWYAARDSDVHMLDVLVEHGGDVNQHGLYGGTPLCVAVENGRTEIVRNLLAHGADVDKPGPNHNPPVFVAASGARADILRLLIDAGADVNSPGTTGMTPLQMVMRSEHQRRRFNVRTAGGRPFEPIIEMLVEAGAR